MTNAEKFKTATERRDAYQRYVRNHWESAEEFSWLEMKAEEYLLPCPFCGSKARVVDACSYSTNLCLVECEKCFGRTVNKTKRDEAIAAWNRRVK